MHKNERIAYNYAVPYTHLGGNIGVLSNGAALCMATNDLIVAKGGSPSNFLDFGGSVIHEQLNQMMMLMEEEKDVKVLLINIFGGIVNVIKLAACIKQLREN